MHSATSHILSNEATIDFHIADSANPVPYEGGPFDLVFAAWLLNYAPSRKHLVEMFRNVAFNLRDGGSFVTISDGDPRPCCVHRGGESGSIVWVGRLAL